MYYKTPWLGAFAAYAPAIDSILAMKFEPADAAPVFLKQK